MEFTFPFIRFLSLGLLLAAPLLLALCAIVVALGLIVGRIEGWSRFDAVYWASVTALTVGYGDFRPSKKRSKALAVAITVAGLMFSGILVAITVHSAFEALKRTANPAIIERVR